MKLLGLDSRLNYPFDPALNFGFEKRRLDLGFTLVISITRPEAISSVTGPAVYFDLEEPNRFLASHLSQAELVNSHSTFRWNRYLTIDPYSHDYFSRVHGRAGDSVFIPTDPERVPEFQSNKKFDLVYTGHILNTSLAKLLDRLSQEFRLAVVSNSKSYLVTHHGLNYDEKLAVIADSRISLVHNLLWPNYRHIWTVRRNLPDISKHGAFANMSLTRLKRVTIPQVKSRLFESAFCGSLPIVVDDIFDIAGAFFPPPLIEFCTSTDVVERVRSLLSSDAEIRTRALNLRDYAFDRYTTDNFIERYLIPFADTL
jgi:hypothetical protein